MSIRYNADFRAAVSNGTLSFSGDLRDLLEQRNAMLMEMFRSLNQEYEDLAENPIMQILNAHNLA